MRILPPSKYWWRPFLLVALILAIAFLVVGPPAWWAAQIRYALAPVLKNRVRDDAGILPKDDESRFEIFLQQIDDESGVDIRFVLVPEVRGESLEDFSVRTARELGVGRDGDRRGLLFVYDTSAHRLRIEVGATMEPIITDAFAGYLIREHVRNFFGTGNPSLGLRTTLFIVQHRLRRAVLAFDDDPRVYQFIEDARRLALGAGASGDMRVDRAQAFLNRPGGSSPEALAYFSPQPSPEAAFARFLEWLGRGGYETDVPLLTPQTQRYIASLPMTRGYNDFILMSEFGQAYRVDTRGELAMLYFTTNPLLSPHLLRRTPAGWTIDIFAELQNTRNYSGYWYTWGLVESGDDFATTFADRYLDMSGVLRVAGGDNRPLPAKAFPDVTLWPAPHPEDSLERVTVEEAAARIAAVPGRSVIMLYPQSTVLALAKIAERCRAAGAEVLAFNMDKEPQDVWNLPPALAYAGAPFPAVHLEQWPSGALVAAMRPVGVRVTMSWAPPIVAVRDGASGVLLQTEGVRELERGSDDLVAACER